MGIETKCSIHGMINKRYNKTRKTCAGRFINGAVAFLLLFVFLCGTIAPTFKALENDGNSYIVSSESDLTNAVSAINSGESGEYTIILREDIVVNSNVVLNCPGSSVTIRGENHTLSMVTSYINATGGSTLNLGDTNYNKTLSIVEKPPASGNACTPLVTANNNSVINMYKGVTLSGRNGVDTAGGVQLEKATFNMYGGEIYNCRSDSIAGGVLAYNNSRFNMMGGSIANCKSSNSGGGIYVYNSQFKMDDGTILNCTAAKSGGGIYIYNSQTEMNGGIIQNCSSTNYGGGVYTNSTFKMTGGVIKGCENSVYGGAGVCARTPTGTDIVGFDMSGGKIVDCVSTSNINYGLGGGVLIINGLGHIKEGSEIYNNHASRAGDDIFSFGTNAKLKLCDVPEGLILSETNHEIDGWYVDGVINGEDTQRWDKDNFAQKYTPSPDETITTQIALKAAHGTIDYNYYNYVVKYYIEGEPDESLTESGTADTVHVDDITAPDGYKIDSIEYVDVIEPTSDAPGSFEVRVYCSKETTPTTEIKCKTKFDGKTIDVILQNPNNVLPDDVYLKVTIIPKNTERWNKLFEELDKTHRIENLLFFNMELLYKSNDKPVQPMPLSDNVRILFQIPNGWDKKDLEAVLVLSGAKDIEFEENVVTINGINYLAFWTNNFTTYALIDKLTDEDDQNSDNKEHNLQSKETKSEETQVNDKQDFENQSPQTGESNLKLFIILGALLVSSSAIIILNRKRKIN